MTGWYAVALAMATTAGLSLGPAPALATADPSGGADGATCTWVPVAPTIVGIAQSKMVTASLQQGPCTVLGNPTEQTVCLEIQGDGTAGNCAGTVTSNPARVYYPYVPGATYVMRGRGCVNRLAFPGTTLCQTFGPSYYTL